MDDLAYQYAKVTESIGKRIIEEGRLQYFPSIEQLIVHTQNNQVSCDGSVWSNLYLLSMSSFYPSGKEKWVEKYGMARPALKPIWTHKLEVDSDYLLVDLYEFKSNKDLNQYRNYKTIPAAKKYSGKSGIFFFGVLNLSDMSSILESALNNLCFAKKTIPEKKDCMGYLSLALEASLISFGAIVTRIGIFSDNLELVEKKLAIRKKPQASVVTVSSSLD